MPSRSLRNDPLFRPLLPAREWARVESYILDDCGHAPHIEKPEQTRAAIIEFCARLDRLEREEVLIA